MDCPWCDFESVSNWGMADHVWKEHPNVGPPGRELQVWRDADAAKVGWQVRCWCGQQFATGADWRVHVWRGGPLAHLLEIVLTHAPHDVLRQTIDGRPKVEYYLGSTRPY